MRGFLDFGVVFFSVRLDSCLKDFHMTIPTTISVAFLIVHTTVWEIVPCVIAGMMCHRAAHGTVVEDD